MKKIFTLVCVIFPIFANLYLLAPELAILSDVNDNVFAYALGVRMEKAWAEGNCPLNLPKCIPKLTDHWVSYWAMGYPLPHYYQHLPSIFNVALFKIFSLLSLVPDTTTPLQANITVSTTDNLASYRLPGLFQVFNWTKYLLLCFYPLVIFISARKFRFSTNVSGLCALLSLLISTNFQYGSEYASLIWRGSGMHTQLWGMFFLPLSLSSIYQVVTSSKIKISSLFSPVILLVLTFHSHLLFGYLSSLSGGIILLAFYLSKYLKFRKENTVLAVFFRKISQNKREFLKPLFTLLGIYIFAFLLLSYWLIPLLMNDSYHAKSVWDELYKFDSFGAKEVINRYFAGEIFDHNRFPIYTILVFAGFFFALSNFLKELSNKNDPNNDSATVSFLFFPLLLIFWTLLYFGRSTWGSLINLLPASDGLHLHRFINGIHFAGVFLSGLGISWLGNLLFSGLKRIYLLTAFLLNLSNLENKNSVSELKLDKNKFLAIENSKKAENSLLKPFLLLLISFTLLYPTMKERSEFVNHNNYLLKNYNTEYLKDYADFHKVMLAIRQKSQNYPGRIWAGRPGNWGRNFKVGPAECYLTLSVNNFDTLGFEPESWSPNTDLEQFFNDQRLDHYELFNIRYIVAPSDQNFPKFAQKIGTYGKYVLYFVNTKGDFEFISSDFDIYGNKYNTINFARFWLDSKWPELHNHPQVFYGENRKNLSPHLLIKDWTNYYYVNKKSVSPLFSLLSNNPFSATPSSLLKEKAKTQKPVPFSLKEIKNINQDTFKVNLSLDKQTKVMLKATYHPYWSAYLSPSSSDINTNHKLLAQQQLPITMVEPYFMSVDVPKGNYQLEFRYRSLLFKKVLMVIGLLVFVFLSFFKIKNK